MDSALNCLKCLFLVFIRLDLGLIEAARLAVDNLLYILTGVPFLTQPPWRGGKCFMMASWLICDVDEGWLTFVFLCFLLCSPTVSWATRSIGHASGVMVFMLTLLLYRDVSMTLTIDRYDKELWDGKIAQISGFNLERRSVWYICNTGWSELAQHDARLQTSFPHISAAIFIFMLPKH